MPDVISLYEETEEWIIKLCKHPTTVAFEGCFMILFIESKYLKCLLISGSFLDELTEKTCSNRSEKY